MHIEINNLSKVYPGGAYALDAVNLTIPQGMYCLLGPGGAGKTTLMRILAGVLRPTEGVLYIGSHDGTSERGRKAVQQLLGYLPQQSNLYPDLSVRALLDYIAVLKGITQRALRRELVDELLHVLGLSQEAQRRLRNCSGATRRRVGIAQALLNNPQLLIVDEPVADLDPQERAFIHTLLCELATKRTVLLSAHCIEDIPQSCQHLALLKRGSVVFQGTLSGLLGKEQERTWLTTTLVPVL